MHQEVSPLDIKIAIVRSGVYQYTLARELGISEIRLSRFLKGRGDLQPELRTQLLERLGLTPMPMGVCDGE